jgi:pimeloyl-ACP methyl ester carboxylesterase
VVHFHGSASSRLERPADETLLHDLNVRLIGVDRPGHGLSDHQPGRRLADWPDDVAQLAGHLHLPRFHVTGYSAGGPHALACAARLPGQVVAAAVIGCNAPPDRPRPYTGMPLPNQLLAWAARHIPWSVYPIRRLMRRMTLGDVEQTARRLMASLPDADQAVLYDPDHLPVFVAAIRDGFRTGSRGVARDDIAIHHDWGFRLSGIRSRVDIWHGQADVNVPVDAATHLDRHIPTTRLTVIPEEGHFLIFRRWNQILEDLVAEART